MEQFRQIGEVLGSLKALMVLKHDIAINRAQCCLLFDVFSLAFEVIAEEIKQNLKMDERNKKWKSLERPLRELHRILKEGEAYIKSCLEVKYWWGKAITFHQNVDAIEFHIHNLLFCFPIVIEAIEAAAEISGEDQDQMQKTRLMLMRKYDAEWNDPKLFQWMFGKQYLVSREICKRLDLAWREDRWLLSETLRDKKTAASLPNLNKHELKILDFLLKKLQEGYEPTSNPKLLPSWVLVGASDYIVKRRLGSVGSHCKEIQWLGEGFALRNFFGDIEPLRSEISLILSLSHPNIMQYFCGFYDQDRKEGFLVMELMNKNVSTYVKENCGQRKRIPFSIPVAVDIILQIARGMEYLHSKMIYHGKLNPSNVLIKPRINGSVEGYFHAKITGFGLTSTKISHNSSKHIEIDPVIWYAPEVLAEQEQPGDKRSCKHTEKADVYSFGMMCFELLTGKVPFEDGHLQGDNMVRNIRAGERPLFSFPFPKCLANLTRKCWQNNPIYRPSFSSICRILRYIKKMLVINPEHGLPEAPPPLVDYCELETGYLKKFPAEGSPVVTPVSQIPFQMFAYRLVEKEKSSGSFKEKTTNLVNEASSPGRSAWISGEENAVITDDVFLAGSDRRSVCSEIVQSKCLSTETTADQRSVFSEIAHFPGQKIAADHKSSGSVTPERTAQSDFDDAEKKIPTTSGSKNPERRNLSTTTADDRPIGSKKKAHFRISPNRRSIFSSIPENKSMKLKISEKKAPSTKELGDTKATKAPRIPKAHSPRSPKRNPKLHSSPSLSPTRTSNAYSSPGSSPTRAPKGYSSSRSSPLNPSACCPHMSRQISLP